MELYIKMLRLDLVMFCIAVIFSACGESDDMNLSSSDPSNIVMEITVSEDNSGLVLIDVSADNAVRYEYYLGEGSNEPVSSVEGHYEHSYETSGSYLIEVRAFGSSGRYVSDEERITVLSKDPVDIGEGYSTPLSYENMNLIWSDEFNDQSLNLNKWSHDIGTGCPENCGWGNNELEYYRDQNVWLENGTLVIEARKESFQGSEYTSGKILTRDKFSFNFGRVDIRATLPEGQGIWPALWMLGVNHSTIGWPECGEIDIMEMIGGNGRENTVYGNVFWDENGKQDQVMSYQLDSGNFTDKYYVFSMIWDQQEICWYVDDELFHTVNITATDKDELLKQFFLIMNVAVGGNWPGYPDESSVFPTQMRVDYIRVFQES